MFPEKRIFDIAGEEEFDHLALELFAFQRDHCAVYGDFCRLMKKTDVSDVNDIPFLPVEFFKSHEVIVRGKTPELVFESSGTTGAEASRHLVASAGLYAESFSSAFRKFYGAAKDYVILALLPSYLERGNSSLVYMTDHLIKQTGRKESGFFLHNMKELEMILREMKSRGQKTILLGVTFALIDFAQQHGFEFPGLIIMETGGMKGRRKEIIREEVHSILKAAFGVPAIHSEYGMTEMMSQAYSQSDGLFRTPPWLRILTRDINDPLAFTGHGISGGINIIDLANVYSCAFISTSDLGKTYADGSFEVLGRFDASEVRGCSLLV